MTPLAFTAGDAAYWGLAVFLVAIGLASAFMLFRLGQTFERLSSFVKGTERDLLPVIVKTGGTVDRVNYELDKLDTVTDSAVSMADSADTAVRAVSTAIATPVEKVSGIAAGIAHGFSQFRKSKDFGEAKTRGAGRGPAARGRPARRSPEGGSHADGDRAPGRAAVPRSAAEARPVAPSRAGGEARPGARAAGRNAPGRLAASVTYRSRRGRREGAARPRQRRARRPSFVFWHSLGHAGNGSFLDVAAPPLDRGGLARRSRSTHRGSAGRRSSSPTPTRSITSPACSGTSSTGSSRRDRSCSPGTRGAARSRSPRPLGVPGDVAGLVLFDSGHMDYCDVPDARPEATIEELIAELHG